MTEPVVMYGIGATKAGTSWLHRYLSSHPDCYLRTIKELHFFDSLEGDDNGWQLKEFARIANQLERRIARGDQDMNGWHHLHLSEIRIYSRVLERGDETAYLAFLHEGRTVESVVGDITPSYALLSVKTLAHMASLAGDARFVYIMRDPVDRLWSHVRMIAKRRSKTGKDIPVRAGRILNRALDGGEAHITDRGDYRAALEKLADAIDPEKLFLCTYEELFSDETLERLCAFLGITPIRGDYATHVHSGVKVKMTPEQKLRAAAYLRPQYDYVASKLGQLPRGWGAAMAGV
jgi:hypothetical protein